MSHFIKSYDETRLVSGTVGNKGGSGELSLKVHKGKRRLDKEDQRTIGS